MSDDIQTLPHARSSLQFRTAPDQPNRLLIVDDEEGIRSSLARFLRSRGFEVYTAECGAAALDLMGRVGFVAVLCDVRMPDCTGLELLPRIKACDPDIAVMMLTAVNDAPTATEALTRGAMDYLTKPVELAALADALHRVLHRRRLLIDQRQVERLVREEVALRTEELEREQQNLRRLSVSVVESLINAQEAKDPHLRGHSHRVGALAASVAEALSLDPDVVEDVRLAGRLHDVGMIGIREDILRKVGPLTPEEYAHVKEHVAIGVAILSPLHHIERAVIFVQDHQEHWDGSGYPRGIAGEDISIGGRIIAIADAYDALTSVRSYRDCMTPLAALEYMRSLSGRLFDPRIFDALSQVVRRRKSLVFINELDIDSAA